MADAPCVPRRRVLVHILRTVPMCEPAVYITLASRRFDHDLSISLVSRLWRGAPRGALRLGLLVLGVLSSLLVEKNLSVFL